MSVCSATKEFLAWHCGSLGANEKARGDAACAIHVSPPSAQTFSPRRLAIVEQLLADGAGAILAQACGHCRKPALAL